MEGKRIVIDPGHGGDEPGAIGPTGLLEKDVNLRVALALKELLEARGAEVFLTRRGDETVPLSERAKIISEASPDLAVSIHHNSTPEPFENRIEVYHPWTRWGPSVELAWLVAERLSQTLHLPRAKPLPAKYSVFKAGVEPFVLVEAGYIADPEEEKRLRTLQREIAEATALADAITEFLTRPRPGAVEVRLRPRGAEVLGEGLDPLLSEAYLNGEKLLPFLNDEGLRFHFPPLAGGTHEFLFLPRSKFGSSGQPAFKRFAVRRKPASASASVLPSEAPPGRVTALLLVKLYDSLGYPVADGTDVSVEVLEPTEVKEFSGKTKGGGVQFLWKTEASGARLRVSAPGFEDLLSVKLPRRDDIALLTGVVEPGLSDAFVLVGSRPARKMGFFFWFSAREISAGLKVWAPGYRARAERVELPKGSSLFLSLRLSLSREGVLRDKRFALYSAHPSFEPLLAELEALLRSAGALVLRSGAHEEPESFAWEAQEWGVQVLLAVFPGPRRRVLHYHRDAQGAALAELIVGAARRELALEFEKGTTGRYVAIHPDGARVVLELQPDPELGGLAETLFDAMINYGIARFTRP